MWKRGQTAVGIEVKSSLRWRSEDGRALGELTKAGVMQSGFGVYLGEHRAA